MKLEMSVPERPGWVFVLPGFDFVMLLLALVMLAGAAGRESYIPIQLPSSEYRGVSLAEGRPIVVMLKSSSMGVSYYMNGAKVAEGDLEEALTEAASAGGTRRVVIEVDRDATVSERFALINLLTKLDLDVLEGFRRDEPVKEGS